MNSGIKSIPAMSIRRNAFYYKGLCKFHRHDSNGEKSEISLLYKDYGHSLRNIYKILENMALFF